MRNFGLPPSPEKTEWEGPDKDEVGGCRGMFFAMLILGGFALLAWLVIRFWP